MVTATITPVDELRAQVEVLERTLEQLKDHPEVVRKPLVDALTKLQKELEKISVAENASKVNGIEEELGKIITEKMVGLVGYHVSGIKQTETGYTVSIVPNKKSGNGHRKKDGVDIKILVQEKMSEYKANHREEKGVPKEEIEKWITETGRSTSISFPHILGLKNVGRKRYDF